MAGRSPSDAEQRVADGAAGPGEGGAVSVQRFHAEEDLQRVQARPRALRPRHPHRLTGQTPNLFNPWGFKMDLIFLESSPQAVLLKNLHKVSKQL